MKKTILYILSSLFLKPCIFAQEAVITESIQTVKTYQFSDPNPTATPSNLIYPYFRFDGFSATAQNQTWKVVTLENDYIKLTIYPEIGGKIWNAIDKTTGRNFIYNNDVIKFRDIAMRGPWTSGGIEFNFGIIGHAPTASTPIDYLTRKESDGSVSCYLSAQELITHTYWNVRINLPKDKAYFTTHTIWHNNSSVDQPYYQWMNAGYPANGNPQFFYPGTNYIGHSGDSHPFPLDEEGRDLSWYEKNNFGNSKSYHVIGHYNDFYGIYWHDNETGSVHYANYDDKLGMKIFLWGLSREGEIWKDLLTDASGQYIELQSGRMYNQPSSGSSFTPYKHPTFDAQATDEWTEYWFPVKDIKGISKASDIGALNVLRADGYLKLYFSPLQKLNSSIKLYNQNTLIRTLPLKCNVLMTWKDSIALDTFKSDQLELKVVIGDNQLVYSESQADNCINRPQQTPTNFNRETTYGLYVQGRQWMNQKRYYKAEEYLQASLKKDPYFLPALINLASLYYRQGRYEQALSFCRTALSINTYEGEANYLYGLCNMALRNNTDAKDGFSVAAYSPSMRSAAYEKLAEMYTIEHNWNKAQYYAGKSLEANKKNLSASHLLAVIYRKTGQLQHAISLIQQILKNNPLYQRIRFEAYLAGVIEKEEWTRLIRSELAFETYMDLATWYEAIECNEEALNLLHFIPDYPIANYKTAYLLHKKGDEAGSRQMVEKANAQSPKFVFPFRPQTLKALSWAHTLYPNNWKIKYYIGLIEWANQNKEKALALFNTCNEVDYAPFFLSKASLETDSPRLTDLQKADSIESTWRTGMALIDYYIANDNWQKAVEIGSKYMKKYPSNYYIGLKYAQALCQTENYQKALSLMKTLQVLPNEGAYIGHSIYRTAHLSEAIKCIQQQKNKQALEHVKKSKEWPENLGVGKPYEDQIDYRVENYLEALVYKKMRNKQKAEKKLSLIPQPHTKKSYFDSGCLLEALALREIGKKALADKMIKQWKQDYPDNQLVQWCCTIYDGKNSQTNTAIETYHSSGNSAPWEVSYRDNNFNLIKKLFND